MQRLTCIIPALKWSTVHLLKCIPTGGASGKKPTCPCRTPKWHRFNLWVWKIPWREKWQPTPVFLPGKFHRQRSLAGCSPGVTKSQTQLSDWTKTMPASLFIYALCASSHSIMAWVWMATNSIHLWIAFGNFLPQCRKVKSESEVTHSCLTLWLRGL